MKQRIAKNGGLLHNLTALLVAVAFGVAGYAIYTTSFAATANFYFTNPTNNVIPTTSYIPVSLYINSTNAWVVAHATITPTNLNVSAVVPAAGVGMTKTMNGTAAVYYFGQTSSTPKSGAVLAAIFYVEGRAAGTAGIKITDQQFSTKLATYTGSVQNASFTVVGAPASGGSSGGGGGSTGGSTGGSGSGSGSSGSGSGSSGSGSSSGSKGSTSSTKKNTGASTTTTSSSDTTGTDNSGTADDSSSVLPDASDDGGASGTTPASDTATTTAHKRSGGAIVGLLALLAVAGFGFWLLWARRRIPHTAGDSHAQADEFWAAVQPDQPAQTVAPAPTPVVHPANNQIDQQINQAFYPKVGPNASPATHKPKKDDLPDMFEIARDHPESYGSAANVKNKK